MMSKIICVGIVGMLYGTSLTFAQTNLANSNDVLIYNSWVNNLARPYQTGAQLTSSSVPTDFSSNINAIRNGNLSPTRNSYKLGYNAYSASSASGVENGHISGSNAGLQPIAGTDTFDFRGGSGIAGGTLAGIIVGSVLGGLLVLAGIISAFLSWRRHMALKKTTLYADYRNNYKAEPIQDVKEHVPGEYYRESHRIGLNNGYNNDVIASTRYRENNNLSFANRENHEVTIPRNANDITSNTNINNNNINPNINNNVLRD